MNLKDALTCIEAGQYVAAVGYMLDEAFKEDIHKLSKQKLRAWERKAAKTLEVCHRELKKISTDEPAHDLAWKAYEEAWERLGFPQEGRMLGV